MLNDGSGNINVPSLTIRGGADGKKGVTVASAGEYKLSIDASAGIFLNGPIVGNNNFYLKSNNKADELVYIYCDSDATDKKKCNIICDLTYITGKTNSQGLLTAQNGIKLTGGSSILYFPEPDGDGVSATITNRRYSPNFFEIIGAGKGPNRLIKLYDQVTVTGVLTTEGGINLKTERSVLNFYEPDGDGVSASITNRRFDHNFFEIIGAGKGPNRLIKLYDHVTVTNTLTSNGLIRASGGLHVYGGLHLAGTDSMVCNGLPILFKAANDWQHGIQCNISAADGPCLFGNNGGALGIRPGGVYVSALEWSGQIANNVPTTKVTIEKLIIRNSEIQIFGIEGRLFFDNPNTEMRQILMGYNRIDADRSIKFGNGKVDFWVNGSVQANKQPSVSDYRLKKNVKDIDEFTTLNLRPVQYDMYEKPEDEEHRIGLIAHEVQEIIPFIVSGVKDGPNYQAISYTDLIPILIKDFQRLHKQNTEQESRIAKLESQISFLMSRIA